MSIPLPPGFLALGDVSNLPTGSIINVLGVIVDSLPPEPTRATDWQCKLELQDPSLLDKQSAEYGLRAKLFDAQHLMPTPQQITVGDIVLIRNIKTNLFSGTKQLLSSRRTQMLFFSSALIPNPAFVAAHISEDQRSIAYTTCPGMIAIPPSAKEQEYVIKLRAWAQEQRHVLPQPRAHMPASRKAAPAAQGNAPVNAPTGPANLARAQHDKFSLLKDARADKYYDLVGEVRKSYDSRNCIELYISDYTDNSLLFDYKDKVDDTTEGRDGDPNGYITSVGKHAWPGPFGKMTIQITLWEPHADFARNNIKEGDIVYIRNALCRFRNSFLQAGLHEDKKYHEEVNIRKLGNSNPLAKNVINRREQYYLARDKVVPQPMSNAQKKKQAKKLRKLAEAKAEQIQEREGSADDMFVPEARDTMNKNIISAHPDKPLLTLSKIMESPHLNFQDRHGTERTLQFVNMKCRAKVRVVDYYPHNIANFAHCLDRPDYNDMSSQYNQDETMDIDDSSMFPLRWEWAFYLLVEDARPTPGMEPVRIPLLVTGQDAVYLLGEDPTDLGYNQQILDVVKRKLFKLWGDLAEKKEDEEAWTPETGTKVANRPFECCIMEYGVPEGDGYRRMHKMFQTTIRS